MKSDAARVRRGRARGAAAVLAIMGMVPCVAVAAPLDCVINPSMTLKIGSSVASTLDSVAVKRGDRVVKGQEIARLETSIEAADVALNAARAGSTADVVQHYARVEFAKAELDRANQLAIGSNIPRQKVEELRTGLRVAQEEFQISLLNRHLAELELARSQALLDQRTIRSPVDGVVVKRLLGPGEFVHQDANIVEIAVVSPLYVEAYPPVNLFGHVAVGQAATVEPDVPVGSRYTATVETVDTVFDAGSGTFGIRLVLPNQDGTLPAGLRCRVTLAGPAP